MAGSLANQQQALKIIRTNSFSSRRSRGFSTVQRVQLDTVLGLTVSSNAGLACNPGSGIVAYTAGCVVVLLDPSKDTQQHLIVANKRTLSSLAFNCDGRFLASGECGQVPCLRVWDTKDLSQVCELPGHKNGIVLVAFSPDTKFLISLGTHHDNLVIVWEWRNGRKVATNKITCKVKGIAFTEDGSFFVTVGNRHVKYWYLEIGKDPRADVVPLVGRSAVLGEYKDECFLDVACGKGTCSEYTYAVTQSGYLCQFNSRRSLEKLTPLNSSTGNCLSAGESGIIVGCGNGDVRVYDPTLLTLITTLPRPHHLGVDVSQFTKPEQLARRPKDDWIYPDCVSISFDEARDRVVATYNDHSIYVWDVHDPSRITKLCSHLYHSRCVWGLDVYTSSSDKPYLPEGSFVSCSSDDTIRIWNSSGALESGLRKNIFCSSTFKIFYNDPSIQFLCNKENNPGAVDPLDVHADSKYGIRCVRFDPHGENVAFGDRLGHIHIYDLGNMREAFKIEAHDSEVLCLEYSKPESGYELLASASRDRLIQVFDVKNDYNCLQTLDDHSSSITALRFATLNGARQFGLLSCGVDKAVILRTIQSGSDSGPKFVLNDQILSKGGIVYDMDIDATSQTIVTANQDRQLRIYGIKSRKLEKTIKGSPSDEGALIKLDLHHSGRFVATSCSDKNLAIIDIVTGECWAAFSGHAEIVTGLRFLTDDASLVSVSGDGCVFVWKVSLDMTGTGSKNGSLDQERGVQPQSPVNGRLSDQSQFGWIENDGASDRMSVTSLGSGLNLEVGSLPSWAKTRGGKSLSSPGQDPQNPPRPGGRWADDVEQDPFDSVEPSPFVQSQDDPLSSHFAFDDSGKGTLSRKSSISDSVANADAKPQSIQLFIPNSVPHSPASTRSSISEHSKASSTQSRQSLGTTNPNPGLQIGSSQSIFGFLDASRKPVRDELDDDDNDAVTLHKDLSVVNSVVDPNSELRGSPETLPDLDSESASNVSPLSPQPSRPQTPSEAANKFLNLSTGGIDKMFKGRLPLRQSITIKRQQLSSSAPVVAVIPSAPLTTPTKPTAPIPVSPSKKLIQSAKLSATRHKYKSTQNLSVPPVVNHKTEELQHSQDINPEMRRAASMTDLQGGNPNFRNGLDGYNSLLERAQARLSAISAKSKADPTNVIPRSLLPRPLSAIKSADVAAAIAAIKPTDTTTVGQESSGEQRKPRVEALTMPKNPTSRSRSSERTAIFRERKPLIVGMKDSSENGSNEPVPNKLPKSLIGRRSRQNSTSRSNGDVMVGAESPTAMAIARIKAELGLAAKGRESSSQETTISVEECHLQCKNLIFALDQLLRGVNSIQSETVPFHLKNSVLTTYCETILEVQSKLTSTAVDLNQILATSGVAEPDNPEFVNLRKRVSSILDSSKLNPSQISVNENR